MSIEPGDIKIKSVTVMRNLLEPRINPTLAIILEDIANTFGIMITEGYRPKRHRDDLHGTTPVRAVDIRSWCYTGNRAEMICDWINSRWQYDFDRPEKKCCIFHDVGYGPHMHIQVHPHTMRT